MLHTSLSSAESLLQCLVKNQCFDKNPNVRYFASYTIYKEKRLFGINHGHRFVVFSHGLVVNVKSKVLLKVAFRGVAFLVDSFP